MNSLPTFGIFVFLLFAYCTPTQGNVYPIREATLPGRNRHFASRGECFDLIRSSPGVYKIQRTSFDEHGPQISTLITCHVEGIDTMIGKNLVLRTTDNLRIQLELINVEDSQQLFTETTGSKLGKKLYSYKVSAVHGRVEGLIVENASISGYEYSTGENPQRKYIVYSNKRGRAGQLVPHVLWTAKDFNYCAHNKNSILLTLHAKPEDHYRFRYVLVQFVNESDLAAWVAHNDQYTGHNIYPAPMEATEYFRHIAPQDRWADLLG